MTTTFGQNVKLLFSIEGRDKNKFRKENKSSEWWHTHICSKTFKILLRRGEGLVVSELAFYSDDLGSNPAENFLQENENKQQSF